MAVAESNKNSHRKKKKRFFLPGKILVLHGKSHKNIQWLRPKTLSIAKRKKFGFSANWVLLDEGERTHHPDDKISLNPLSVVTMCFQ